MSESPSELRSFDPDLDRILDRVYQVDFGSAQARVDARLSEESTRNQSRADLAALEAALDGLRALRERGEGVAWMRDEIAYLQEQIQALKDLCEQIGKLRAELAAPPRSHVRH